MGLLAAWAPAALAQDTLAATTVGAEASVALHASPPDTSVQDASTEDSFMKLYTPQANTFELGAFAGLVFISDKNSFRAAPSTPGGVLTPRPYSEYK